MKSVLNCLRFKKIEDLTFRMTIWGSLKERVTFYISQNLLASYLQ